MPGGIHPPLDVMASWPAPNFVNPETRPKDVLVLACVFGPLTLCLLVARLWVRIRIQHNAGWDDWLMLIAMIPILALTILIPIVSEVHGFNQHVWDLQIHNYITQRKFVMVIEAVFCAASGLIKISILLFYKRLSSRAISSTFRWATWITIGFIAAFSIAFTLVPIFGCTPVSAFWDQLDIVKVAQGYQYRCFNEGADVFAAGVISAVQDLITAMLPTCLYWNLHIPFRQKVALFGIFAIGYGVVAIGAVRAYVSWHIFFETYDVTWAAWYNVLWTLVELHVGAMCANAPALKVFFGQFLRLDRLTSRSRSKSKSNGSKPTDPKTLGSSKSGSTYDKVAFWKRSQSQSRSGYLSEPHTNVSVDVHGGVRLQNEIRDTSSPIPLMAPSQRHSKATTTESTEILSDRFYDDIEMGNYEVEMSKSIPRDLDEQGLQALPSISPHPRYIHNTAPRSPPTAWKSSSSSSVRSKKPARQTWA